MSVAALALPTPPPPPTLAAVVTYVYPLTAFMAAVGPLILLLARCRFCVRQQFECLYLRALTQL